MRQIDQKLIGKAQKMAGRHVHQVANLIHSYQLSAMIVTKEPDCQEWQIMFDAREAELRVFVAGALKEAGEYAIMRP